MASVQMRHVLKDYAGQPILKGVDFDIRDGEFLSLVGPSGCGKSTLLRMIAGLETISGGEILIGGEVVNGLAAKDRDIAMVFQNYALYPHMTVRENLSFTLEMRGEPKSSITSQIDRVAAILDVAHLLERYPRQLSGGQQQRVAMGRAIVRNPRVFLFDEPLSNLDAKLRVHMRGEIKDLHENLKTTMIYVTHDQIEAMTMADRIVVMRTGVIEQIGTPLELYDRPANTFVATFIGSPAMNLLSGVITDSDQGQNIVLDDGQILRLPSGTGRVAASTHLKVGLRPEHLSLAENGIAATVAIVEPTGAETQIVAQLAGQRIMATLKGRPSLQRGETIHLNAEPDHIHVFDAESGRRL